MISASQLATLKDAYSQGLSITGLLKSLGIPIDSKAIEIIYDLQAGSYTRFTESNPDFSTNFVNEIADIVGSFILPGWSLLDAGTGESTTLIPLLERLNLSLTVLAFDISWSRLSWAKENASLKFIPISFAVADLCSIPLADNSIDCAMTIHALEPNGGKESEILAELSRVARELIILIEPDFDNASAEQKGRMQNLSYIGKLDAAISAAGWRLLEKIPIRFNLNPLNAASVFILAPEHVPKSAISMATTKWVDPFFHDELFEFEGGLRGDQGFWFPQLRGIPFLRAGDAKLAMSPLP